MADELSKIQARHEHMTFLRAAEDYVDMKRNVLSPRTIKEYSEMPGRLPDWWNQLPVSDITQIEINRLVNEISKGKSPKTVRNYHGFVSAVLGTFCPSLKICTTLPQKVNFPLHKLRHYFASQMSALGVPDADILKMGGWETDHVMKSVYRHSMLEKEEQAKRAAVEKFRSSLFS